MRLRVKELVIAAALTVTGASGMLGALTSVASARAHGLGRVPQGFVGIDGDGPLFENWVDLSTQLDGMVSNGVQSMRVVFSWSDAQPVHHWKQIPAAYRPYFTNVGGVPTNFAATDRVVAAAAAHRISLLPVVMYAPKWDARHDKHAYLPIPKRNGPYGAYLAGLVHRYGPKGTFWKANPSVPKVPIHMWEIWNEPLFPYNWFVQPFQRSYLAMLKVAHSSIKHADRAAKVVLAGFPNYAWITLQQLYKLGARKYFDVVDVHPYTRRPSNVIKFVQLVRQTMKAAGDRRKPILLGEFGWPSSKGHPTSQHYVGIETTQAGEAKRISAVLPMLAAHRKELGILAFYYYTWMSNEYPGGPSFNWSGLLTARHGKITPKPALTAFRRAALKIEGCKKKGSTATACMK